MEDPFPLIQAANSITDPSTGKQLEYKQLINHPDRKIRQMWQHSSANEFGCLAQGMGGRIEGTDTIKFLRYHEMLKNRRPTYVRFVCEIHPQKAEKERTRLMVGGNLIDYPDTVTTRTCDLVTFKMHIYITLSQPNRKYCSFDVKNFYLNTPMEHSEYMKIPSYKSQMKSSRNTTYETKSTLTGRCTSKHKREFMGYLKLACWPINLYGYYEVRHTPGYWHHTWRPIDFTLIVDDFGVGYEHNEHALHLLQTLRQYYEAVSVDWTGTLYCGIILKWDYGTRTCELSMPRYVQHDIHKFHDGVKGLNKATDTPHPYKATKKLGLPMTQTMDDGTRLSPQAIKQLQQIVGTFLFYARAVDPTMLTALSIIATEQSQGTHTTKEKAEHFLTYATTHPNATIKYYKSDMILKIHSDASYLSK